MKKILLAGMPNCGKSSVFNALTHSSVYVGNRAGVTVDSTSAQFVLPDGSTAQITDIPGITSLTPHTADEEVATELLFRADADLIVNVIDVNDLTRQLALTMRLCELFGGRIPIILCLNMCDIAEKRGQKINTLPLSHRFGLPVVTISASKKSGLDTLKNIMSLTDRKSEPHFPADLAERKAQISKLASAVLVGKYRSGHFARALDIALLNRRFGIFLFFLTVSAVMFITFGPPGNLLTSLFSKFIISPVGNGVSYLCERFLPASSGEFVTKGVFGGISAVLTFLPRIILMFAVLCTLEDCGYMARAASVSDRFLRRIGLDGRACVSVMLGFGCTVPAIMSCRNMTDCRERNVCCATLPLLSCSARVPVYSLICDFFFGSRGWLAAFAVHMLGTVMFFTVSAVTRKLRAGASSPHYTAMLPVLRLPSAKHIFGTVKNELFHFLKRAGTVIFAVSCLTYLMSKYSFSLTRAEPQESMLAFFGGAAARLFGPLGFESWQAGAALICGIGAKEAVISVLYELCPSDAVGNPLLYTIFTPQSALSFTVFMSMYLPCVASFVTSCGEIGVKRTARGTAVNFAVAYACAFAVYTVIGAVL